jgi:hypothetical protein
MGDGVINEMKQQEHLCLVCTAHRRTIQMTDDRAEAAAASALIIILTIKIIKAQ